jgi:hypothetical protein
VTLPNPGDPGVEPCSSSAPWTTRSSAPWTTRSSAPLCNIAAAHSSHPTSSSPTRYMYVHGAHGSRS